MKNLADLYKEHEGKLSDKWSLYLDAYDDLLSKYQSQPVSMLEIGIQNGGSLEIWAKYFSNAKAIIGCDINPECRKLAYDDPRIKVVVGDAGNPKTKKEIMHHVPVLDVVIEDGSHRSGDIIKAFAMYFPLINVGGTFIAEDLHCSYWQEYEGGLHYPYSSVRFFKVLSDMVNHEHWGVKKSRVELIHGFLTEYRCSITEDVLATIHSVEFLNSVCVIKKKSAPENLLGKRCISGKTADVVSEVLPLHGAGILVLDQSSNRWSSMEKSPEEEYLRLCQSIENRDGIIERQAENIAELQCAIARFENSRSWRYTALLRRLGQFFRSVNR